MCELLSLSKKIAVCFLSQTSIGSIIDVFQETCFCAIGYTKYYHTSKLIQNKTSNWHLLEFLLLVSDPLLALCVIIQNNLSASKLLLKLWVFLVEIVLCTRQDNKLKRSYATKIPVKTSTLMKYLGENATMNFEPLASHFAGCQAIPFHLTKLI